MMGEFHPDARKSDSQAAAASSKQQHQQATDLSTTKATHSFE